MSLAVSPAASAAPAFQDRRASSFTEWRRVMHRRFEQLDLSPLQDEAAFRGRLRSITIGQTRISDVAAGPHTVCHREERLLGPRTMKLVLLASGRGILRQDDRVAHLRPGDLAFYDTSRPYTLEFREENRCVVLMFPIQAMGVSEAGIRSVTAVRFPGDVGIAKVVGPFLNHLGQNLDELTEASGDRVMRAVRELVACALLPELQVHGAEPGPCRMISFEDACAYIEDHLGDPELSAAAVARACFVSVRTLQYLFHREELTVSDYVRARRLERCRLDLLDPFQRSIPILQIAHRWGFANAGHFSRAFKEMYGTSPRECRRSIDDLSPTPGRS